MGTLSRRTPWCFSKGVGYMPAPGFTFSLFHIHNRHSHLTTPHTHNTTLYTHSSSYLHTYTMIKHLV
ncbi:hypothetical protein C0J52_02721 [Blattella germanica]|nr:hypothetical protein C0J52_02721 [Blattella germanica]